jgi:hypothetical protein
MTTAPAEQSNRLQAVMAAPSSAQVALTAWQNPIIALLDSGDIAENYVFGRYYNLGQSAFDPGEANWPFAGFAQPGGDVLNFLLTKKAELGNYFYVGFLPNFTFEAYLPAVQQWQLNAEDYTSVFLSGLNRGARQLVEGKWAEAGKTVLDATTYVLTNFAARAKALVAVLPQILKTFAGSAIGGAQILVQKTVAIVQQVVASLGAGDWEGAWNAAVNGTLGPSGLPGTLLNLTTGAGVQTGPIVNPETDIPGNFVPSARTAFQAAQWTARGALQTSPSVAAAVPVPVPVQGAEPAPAAAVIGDIRSAAVEPAAPAGAADLADAVAATGGTADAGVPSAPADSAAPEEPTQASGRAAAPDRKAAGTGHARRGPAGGAGD